MAYVTFSQPFKVTGGAQSVLGVTKLAKIWGSEAAATCLKETRRQLRGSHNVQVRTLGLSLLALAGQWASVSPALSGVRGVRRACSGLDVRAEATVADWGPCSQVPG